MVTEIKTELFIGGYFDGVVFSTPLDSNAVEIESMNGIAEVYTRRRIEMLPVYRELFALRSMTDEQVKDYLKTNERG